jgi:hypothetical protein
MLVAAAVITTRLNTKHQALAVVMVVAQVRVMALAVVVQRTFVGDSQSQMPR